VTSGGHSRPAVRHIPPGEQVAVAVGRHAELAWAVARWILPRLEETDRQAVQEATRAAVDALAAEGDPRVVSMLTGHVWERAA